jgi:hypothetical protein
MDQKTKSATVLQRARLSKEKCECMSSLFKYTGSNSRYKEVLAHPQKFRYNLKFVVSKIHFVTKFSILGQFFRYDVKQPSLWPLALTSCSILAVFSGFSQACRVDALTSRSYLALIATMISSSFLLGLLRFSSMAYSFCCAVHALSYRQGDITKQTISV